MPSATTSIFSISRYFPERLTRRVRAGLDRAKVIWAEVRADLRQPRMKINWDGTVELAEDPWRRYWGHPYGPELKTWLLEPVFEQLEKQGKLGNLIVDVGSGAWPVTGLLKGRVGRKRILIDIAADNSRAAEGQRIRMDAEKIDRPEALSFKKAWVRVCRYLGLDPLSDANGAGADTILFSDLLNYVDFEKVLGGFAAYLKPGGRIIVSNLPMRGNEALFSDKGLRDNRQLFRFLGENGFEIERKSFPCRPADSMNEAGELIVLVARKCG